MEEVESAVCANGKKQYYTKCVLLGKVGQLYIEDRKMVKCLIAQLNREKKNLGKSCYPLTDADKRDVAIALTELRDIFNGFLHPAELERYNICIESLKNYISKLEAAINPNPAGAVAKKAIDVAKDTAKTLGEKIGKGVEELKKTVQGISSK